MRTLLAAVLVTAAGCSGLWSGTDGLRAFTFEQARRLAVAEHPVALPEVVLQDQSGRLLQLADFRGKLVLVDFIYTRCASVCLTLGTSFQQIYRRLRSELGAKVVLLSISFDPVRDTPEMLYVYAQRMGADGSTWIMVRPYQVQQLSRLLDTFGIVVIADRFGGFQHNGAIHLLDRQGRLAGIFDYDAPAVAANSVLQRL